MYYPFFRGKKFELIAIAESAKLMADSGFTPIIEPVSPEVGFLEKTLSSINANKGEAIVIINPPSIVSHNPDDITKKISAILLKNITDNHNNLTAGIMLHEGMPLEEIYHLYRSNVNLHPSFIYTGFNNPKKFSTEITPRKHIFFEKYYPYQKHLAYFPDSPHIVLRDGFRKRNNKEYPPAEDFPSLYNTFKDTQIDGFGDFQIVGDYFSNQKNGGHIRAVAIHLTTILSEGMVIYHFVSDTHQSNGTVNTPGMFYNALTKMINFLDSSSGQNIKSAAIDTLYNYYTSEFFSTLGDIKRLSINHHIEILSQVFSTHKK